jgi:surface antigen
MTKIGQVLAGITVIMGLVGSSVLMPVRALGVTETGGYPWATAELVRAATYDWGYTTCQPAMQAAKTCGAHIVTKMGRRYYESDPWHYDVRNCTSYVAWRINQEFGVDIPGWGNANQWATAAAKAGYRVDQTPAVGTIAVWESYYGHVAYVTAVNPDGSVNVEQYNKAGTGEFSRQSRVHARHYIHIHDQPPKPTVISAAAAAVPATDTAAVNTKQPTAAGLPAPKVEPLAPLQPTKEAALPQQAGVSYVPALDPISDRVSIYAVQYKTTNSGNIEISQSNVSDGNTTWAQHWQTSQAVTADSLQVLVADANADGRLDVYLLQTDSATKRQQAIILDGGKDYKTTLGDWQTDQAATDIPASYSLADYDGNGSLDLFAIEQNTVTANITILDGSNKFAHALAQWQAPADGAEKVMYEVGDHDRDGKADIYAVSNRVVVLNATTNYQQISQSWKMEAELPASGSS